MAGYSSYKHSKIDWLGDIPSHWDTIPLRYTALGKGCTFIDGDWIESKNISTEGIKYLTTGNVGPGYYKEQGSGYITEETFKELNCTDVFPGDLLISRLNEPIARTCIVPDLDTRIVTAVDNVIYRPNANICDKRYVCYWLNNAKLTEHANVIARGATMHRISRTMLGHLPVLLPPLGEQKAIADYLDAECKKIDDLIKKEEKRVQLIEETKLSIITKAITKGLNESAIMKDSGVPWVGLVPNSWVRHRIKYDLTRSAAGVWGDEEKGNDDDIVCYRIADYDYSRGILDNDSPTIRNIPTKERQGRLLRHGDLLIEKSGGGDVWPVGRVVRYNYEIDAVCSNFIHSVTVDERKINQDFLYYYFRFLYANKVNLLYFNQTTGIQNLKVSAYLSQSLYAPELDEQKEIVEYLNKECDSYDIAINKVNHQIDLLKEYKQSLITEVVTGKRKVC